ncbi:MAG: hypothetical protein SFY66_19695 [Oculatellaceae cyanobacterium bins.114]|nr:hypothetical protein [Oculatellaceae cyanobacterium bins.114]
MTLTVDEKIRRSHLEQTIERGLKAFYEAGQALMEMRDRRLYREEFATFEDYCQTRWEMSKTHANRLIEAAEVIETLTPIGVILPINESQARPLAPLSVEARVEVMQASAAIAPSGKPTAAHVQRAVEAVKTKPQPLTPGQRLTVLDEQSPYYGEEVEVVAAEGLIVECQVEGVIGKTAFLSNELSSQPKRCSSIEQTWKERKHSPVDELRGRAEIAEMRVEALERLLGFALVAIKSGIADPALIEQIEAALA